MELLTRTPSSSSNMNLQTQTSMQNSDRDRTLFCINIDPNCSEDILYELFLQAGPIENIVRKPDRNGKVICLLTYKYIESCEWAIKVFNGVYLFNQSLKVQFSQNNLNLTPRNSSASLMGTPQQQQMMMRNNSSSSSRPNELNTMGSISMQMPLPLMMNQQQFMQAIYQAQQEISSNDQEHANNGDGNNYRSNQNNQNHQHNHHQNRRDRSANSNDRHQRNGNGNGNGNSNRTASESNYSQNRNQNSDYWR